jgi:hypothetical protein
MNPDHARLGLFAEIAFQEKGRMLRQVSGARFDKYVRTTAARGEEHDGNRNEQQCPRHQKKTGHG